jgi:uncharacterized membrane protein
MSGFFKRGARILRHLLAALSGAADRRLPRSVHGPLQRRIAASEARHTGQIRIYAESSLPWSYLARNAPARERAITLFGKLRVWDTENNNGVLIYLLMAEHAIEIIADRGLNQHIPREHWVAVIARMQTPLRAGRWEDGLLQAIDEISEVLEQHFPATPGEQHPNELPDAPIVR